MKSQQIFEDICFNYTKVVMDVFGSKNVKKTIQSFKKIKTFNELYESVWEMLVYEANSEISKLHDACLQEYSNHKHKFNKQWSLFNDSQVRENLFNESEQSVKAEVLSFIESKKKKCK